MSEGVVITYNVYKKKPMCQKKKMMYCGAATSPLSLDPASSLEGVTALLCAILMEFRCPVGLLLTHLNVCLFINLFVGHFLDEMISSDLWRIHATYSIVAMLLLLVKEWCVVVCDVRCAEWHQT